MDLSRTEAPRTDAPRADAPFADAPFADARARPCPTTADRLRAIACVGLALGAHVLLLAPRGAPNVRTPSRIRPAGGLTQSVDVEQEPSAVEPANRLPTDSASARTRPRARAPTAPMRRNPTPSTLQRTVPTRVLPEPARATTAPLESGPAPVVMAATEARAVRLEQGANASTLFAIASGEGREQRSRKEGSRSGFEQAKRHGPRLLTPEACRRFFPEEARDDDGAVVLALRVGESGAVLAPRVLSELPPHQGFARAALHCASFLKFEPAESVAGARLASTSVVRLRFARSSLQ